MAHHYRFRSTGASSEKYGNCEICKKHCSEVFAQTHLEDVAPSEGEPFKAHRGGAYGHAQCLEQVRIKPYQLIIRTAAAK